MAKVEPDKETRIKENTEKLHEVAKKHKELDKNLCKNVQSMTYQDMLTKKGALKVLAKEMNGLIRKLAKDGVEIEREKLRREV